MELLVQKREITGKKVKSLRNQGLVPAELYGQGISNSHLVVKIKDFKKVFKEAGENTIINLQVEGSSADSGQASIPVLIYDTSHDPVSDEVRNIDFYKVRLDKKLRVKVPIDFSGESLAVKQQAGILVKAMQEIEVEALPADIPHSFVVDLSKLVEINQSFYVNDLPLEALAKTNVKILVDEESVIATIKPKLTEEQEKALEESAVPSVETVKVETEEKKAERMAEKEVVETKDEETKSPTPEAKK